MHNLYDDTVYKLKRVNLQGMNKLSNPKFIKKLLTYDLSRYEIFNKVSDGIDLINSCTHFKSLTIINTQISFKRQNFFHRKNIRNKLKLSLRTFTQFCT